MRRNLTLAFAAIFTLFLAGCDTAEERAESHYQSALLLIESEDYDRAVVELRNVFQLVPNHFEARHEIARVMREDIGDPVRAYRQYLRIAEQYPEDLKARVALSQLAFAAGNWDELQRHGAKAVEIAPEDTEVAVIGLALAYQASIENDVPVDRRATANSATAMLTTLQGNRILREIILDNHLRENELSASLALLDELTSEFPDQQRYWSQRLQVLIQIGDDGPVERQLIEMIERFPEDSDQKATLIRYYLSRGDLDASEAFLRSQVETAEAGNVGPRVDLVRFLTELRSLDAGRAEIDLAVEQEPDPLPFIILGAALDYSDGQPTEAINALENVLEKLEPSEQTNEVKMTLARMLLGTGNEVGARALVEGILVDDPLQVGALRMNAQWLIGSDDTDGAIASLRSALDQDPEDAETLSLMAQAYARSGSNDLSKDFLALAVDASGNAPEETIQYVRVLLNEERYLSAEDILLPALRIAPNDLRLLSVAGELYLEMNDMGRASQVAETLRRIETPQALQLANRIDAERLNRESGAEEAMAFLEGIANSSENDVSSQLLLIRARISSGDVDSALAISESLVEEFPDDPRLETVLANTIAVSGDLARAEDMFRALIEEYPTQAGLWIQVAQLRARQEDVDGARTAIADGLEAIPGDATLLWAHASYLEQDGEIDAAIAVYEELYERDTSSVVVANNLASLIATYREDTESLDQAWRIARRFRDADIPALQDTYGWITHRRGDSEEAVEYLTGAAAGLPQDVIVQFHLAEALLATGRASEALAQYRIVLDLAGPTDTRDQIATSRTRIQEIEAQTATDQ